MTAYDMYFQALPLGHLPASVPIERDGEQVGVATTTFDVRLMPEAHAATLHQDFKQRALMAIYACRTAHEAVESGLIHQ